MAETSGKIRKQTFRDQTNSFINKLNKVFILDFDTLTFPTFIWFSILREGSYVFGQFSQLTSDFVEFGCDNLIVMICWKLSYITNDIQYENFLWKQIVLLTN